ncbi:hypothetical protein DFP72DRAFT_1171248 [Ephemerocybe angulata]|uniref:Chromo domain-containing protein n=1 Tax=Ephemerocybe angulata TaxID=980116 RepID=A0A8H6HTS7_9AGAR|nr:hypothetical protein DFP72DRAFT_1171248 [Tulosesus angulatus]
MARATSPSGSENSDDVAPTKEKTVDEGEDEVESDEEGGEEYEIEAILDAKRGVFEEGSVGYLVKWKGYPSGENSWVKDTDIGGAGDLVDAFWKQHPRKSNMLSSASKKKGRQSTAGASASAAETGKKRGRKSTTKMDTEDEDEAPSTSRAAKKLKNNGASASTGIRTQSPEIGAHHGNMDQYRHLKSWEDLVKTVDTVERSEEDQELYVYFTLYDGGVQVKELSNECRTRFPQKLLEFYESNLRWKATTD